MTLTSASTTCRTARTSRTYRIRTLLSVWRQRHALERLDSRALEDVGLTKTEAREEASKPIWDAPDNWRC